ncbi:MFS transporter [Limnohabitans sp. G3-2]|uniref:MFS transporter n=1 Tax=Limnohabitans sp. G3-2 TaxID=1100711 RepID=UPI000C1F6D18|nr:MFS transporter [Limnohabitans sp. G3-2]PIT71543.1 hypothetical protein B9Z31_15010 [Limnohabitans sp. G3-2]
MNPAIYALALASFAIGTTEFVIMGLLPEVATDLNVSLVQAGWLITGYALGVALGAPSLTLMGRYWPRKRLLIGLMCLFIAGNLWAAWVNDYTQLMLARVLASLAHGSFFGVGSVLAARLVPPEKQAQAVAVMFTGLTLANILGVPAGTWMGQLWGWHSTFASVAALGVMTLLMLMWLLPEQARETPTPLKQELAVLARLPLLRALACTVLSFGGVFTLFTYISPYLQSVSSVPTAWMGAYLLLFGIGSTLGNILGGRWADRSLRNSLLFWVWGMVLVLALMPFLATEPFSAAIAMLMWGLFGFAIVPALQMQVLQLAREAPQLSASLNISAFNIGNALGAWIGGLVLPLGFPAVAWAAAAVTALGGVLLLWPTPPNPNVAPATQKA